MRLALVLAAITFHQSVNALPALLNASPTPYFQPRSLLGPVVVSSDINGTLSLSDAAAAAMAHFGTEVDLEVTTMHTSDAAGMHHVYYRQMMHGLPIVNAVAQCNMLSNGDVVTMHSVLVDVMDVASQARRRGALPMVPVDVALLRFAFSKGYPVKGFSLKITQNGNDEYGSPQFDVVGAPFALLVKATQRYYQTPAAVVLAWDLSVETKDGHWYNAFVCVSSGEVLGVSDWSSQFSASDNLVASQPLQERQQLIPNMSYNVVAVGRRNPLDDGVSLEANPWDLNASPFGWQYLKDIGFSTTTEGNNVAAQSNPNKVEDNAKLLTLARPTATKNQFRFPIDLAKGPENPNNAEAAIVNVYYLTNIMHDVFYSYGFTETTGNFQFDNMGKGGKESDGIIAIAQAASGKNNANFVSPPDGDNGKMSMFIFDSTIPNRDGAFEANIVIHELTHGLSNRLTGGANNANCLSGNPQSQGLGEGYSDIVALIMTMQPEQTRFVPVTIGGYSAGKANGVRTRPYTSDAKVNNHLYSDLNKITEIHSIGEIWCSMLWEVYWNLIDLSGAVPAAQIGAASVSGAGNTNMMQILVMGMKMQPCNPNFLQARDAMIAANNVLYAGGYACAIWRGFASRGLGLNAAIGKPFVDNFDLPAACS
ncbi:Fungalysin metallopeptidase-domain-containing protein [Chytriomyces sp. MP71]|nr:Fungalysin metallopeptidase-domain-containing protein [Chytriomyces sp. MP71]